MSRIAYGIIDLGFGDSGKGTVVDFLTRYTGAKLVVRFNGGAQAGHNVVTNDGKHHTFSQFGSGSLVPGVKTVLSQDVAIHPIALQAEAKHLESLGVTNPMDNMIIHENCLVTTPYHQALNCIRELSKGANRHGSCGVGFGETIRYSQNGRGTVEDMTVIRAKDLLAYNGASPLLRMKLQLLRNKIRDEVAEIPTLETQSFEDKITLNKWLDVLALYSNVDVIAELMSAAINPNNVWSTSMIAPLINGTEVVIFEGAQGVLIDENWGFAPYNTWSTTTGKNILNVAPFLKNKLHMIGVTRAYPTRHGPGPFPTFNLARTSALQDEHNPANKWQGAIRTGYFDSSLLRYALDVCYEDLPIDGLVITHLDQIDQGGIWSYSDEYFSKDHHPYSPREVSRRLMGVNTCARAKILNTYTPHYKNVNSASPHNVLGTIEHLTGGPRVWIKSFGPTARDKEATDLLPLPPT
jgi:adenylosuccinate synthase